MTEKQVEILMKERKERREDKIERFFKKILMKERKKRREDKIERSFKILKSILIDGNKIEKEKVIFILCCLTKYLTKYESRILKASITIEDEE